MSRKLRGASITLVLVLVARPCPCATTPDLLALLAQELERNFKVLQARGEPAPYFMAYQVTEETGCGMGATLGALLGTNCEHTRVLDVTVRVGSPELDNYHRVPGERPVFTSAARLPVEDVPEAIRLAVWRETDRVYRSAAERLIRLKTSTQVRAAPEEEAPDFSREKSVVFINPPPAPDFSVAKLESFVRKVSAVFARYPSILTSQVTASVRRQVKYFVSTEGTRLVHGRNFSRVVIAASTRATDGMDLPIMESFEAAEPTGLPSEKVLLEIAQRLARQLQALREAPVAEPFVGPAILSGRAAGVLFHEIFGHRVEGHRQRDESEGQTFAKSIGQVVMPPFLSVIFDPTRRRMGNTDLNGFYLFDDEGVPSQKVTVVESGVLRTFLLSRTPLPRFPNSNGHGRRQPGYEVVSRQSNLIVESARAVPEPQLRQMLREEIIRQKKPYGLYFELVTGGLTQTRRGAPQAFAVIPLLVYRVYPDGRPDELVRGVEIVGTPLAAFGKILATSDRQEVFNGYCGAESGTVPVSAVAPALVISEIETQRRQQSVERPPLLPSPLEQHP